MKRIRREVEQAQKHERVAGEAVAQADTCTHRGAVTRNGEQQSESSDIVRGLRSLHLSGRI
jgi:hypothetical protein